MRPLTASRGGLAGPGRPARLANPLGLAAVALSACAGPPPTDTPPPTAAEGYVAGAEGVRLYYRLLGEGTDTVVVVHGGPGAGMKSILPFLEPLSEHLALLFYDQRGGGESDLPADTTRLGIEFFVGDLEAVRRHFGFERMTLVAHSYGSILAAEYAIRHPDRLERMAFVGATGPSLEGARDIARRSSTGGAAADSAARRRAGELVRTLLGGEATDPVTVCREYEALLSDLAPAPSPGEAWPGTVCDYPGDVLRYSFRYTQRVTPRSVGAWDYRNRLEHLEAPLLVIYGAADSLEMSEQRAWARAVPNGRLLPSGGFTKAGSPSVVIPALRSFLTGGTPTPRLPRRH